MWIPRSPRDVMASPVGRLHGHVLHSAFGDLVSELRGAPIERVHHDGSLGYAVGQQTIDLIERDLSLRLEDDLVGNASDAPTCSMYPFGESRS